MLLCTVTEMNGLDVVRGGTGGGVFLYATRHDEPAGMEGEERRMHETGWRERDTVEKREKAGQSRHPRGASEQQPEAEVQNQPTGSSSHREPTPKHRGSEGRARASLQKKSKGIPCGNLEMEKRDRKVSQECYGVWQV